MKKEVVLLLLLIGTIYLSSGGYFTQAVDAKNETLPGDVAALRSIVNSSYWASGFKWEASRPDPCYPEIDSIVCEQDETTGYGRITMLIPSLGQIDSTQEIPAAVNNLTALVSINFHNGNFGNLVTNLTTLTNLRRFSCSNCRLTNIPLLPSSLQFIDVSSNSLTSLGNLLDSTLFPTLYTVSAESNQINIHPTAGVTSSTSILYMDGNDMSGHNNTWDFMRSFPNLASFFCTNCKINGVLGQFLPSKIENLYLDNNTLSGPLPAEWSTSKFIATVNLNNNQLTGAIPDSWQNIRTLNILNVDHNKLSGTPPDWINDNSLYFSGVCNNWEVNPTWCKSKCECPGPIGDGGEEDKKNLKLLWLLILPFVCCCALMIGGALFAHKKKKLPLVNYDGYSNI